ncbi:MAG: hypothetical protein DRI46_09405 [Chloroflexi bacterium]|nr:MAG: hypothetical protein DRI46_09405 [Chloroflexota bacterium]
MAITIDGMFFPSREIAAAHIKKIRDKYSIGESLNKNDSRFMVDLLRFHPDSKSKIGEGVDFFTVEIERVYKNKHFMIHRVDGSRIDFSYLACLHKKTVNSAFIKAARREISDEIISFKKGTLARQYFCPISAIELHSKNSHVDHLPPFFADILKGWLKKEDYKPETIVLLCIGTDTCFSSREIASSWQFYHLEHSNLRLISIKSHKENHARKNNLSRV